MISDSSLSYETANLFRPLALLRFKTLMPPTDRILALNPWVRAFLILLGW
jgi:hypothetical protein